MQDYSCLYITGYLSEKAQVPQCQHFWSERFHSNWLFSQQVDLVIIQAQSLYSKQGLHYFKLADSRYILTSEFLKKISHDKSIDVILVSRVKTENLQKLEANLPLGSSIVTFSEEKVKSLFFIPKFLEDLVTVYYSYDLSISLAQMFISCLPTFLGSFAIFATSDFYFEASPTENILLSIDESSRYISRQRAKILDGVSIPLYKIEYSKLSVEFFATLLLIYLCDLSDKSIIDFLESNVDNPYLTSIVFNEIDGETPLNYALVGGKYLVADKIFLYGVNPNMTVHLDITPLNVAVHNGDYQLVEVLIKHNVDLNNPGTLDKSNLAIAVKNQDVKIIKLLLDNGAKVEYHTLSLLSQFKELLFSPYCVAIKWLYGEELQCEFSLLSEVERQNNKQIIGLFVERCINIDIKIPESEDCLEKLAGLDNFAKEIKNIDLD
jgi:hypothetical protein